MHCLSAYDAACVSAAAEYPSLARTVYALTAWMRLWCLDVLHSLEEEAVSDGPVERKGKKRLCVLSPAGFTLSHNVCLESLSFTIHACLPFQSTASPQEKEKVGGGRKIMRGRGGGGEDNDFDVPLILPSMEALLHQLLHVVVLAQSVDLEVHLVFPTREREYDLVPSSSSSTGFEPSSPRRRKGEEVLWQSHYQYDTTSTSSSSYDRLLVSMSSDVERLRQRCYEAIPLLLHTPVVKWGGEGGVVPHHHHQSLLPKLSVRCVVHNLFIRIPVRRLPFVMEDKNASPTTNHHPPSLLISFEARRREEQEHLHRVACQSAVEVLLAPLFFQLSHGDPRRSSSFCDEEEAVKVGYALRVTPSPFNDKEEEAAAMRRGAVVLPPSGLRYYALHLLPLLPSPTPTPTLLKSPTRRILMQDVVETTGRIIFSFFPSLLPPSSQALLSLLSGGKSGSGSRGGGGFGEGLRDDTQPLPAATFSASSRAVWTPISVCEEEVPQCAGEPQRQPTRGYMLVVFWDRSYLRWRLGAHAGSASKFAKMRRGADTTSLPPAPLPIHRRSFLAPSDAVGGSSQQSRRGEAAHNQKAMNNNNGNKTTSKENIHVTSRSVRGKSNPYSPSSNPAAPPLSTMLLSLLPSPTGGRGGSSHPVSPLLTSLPSSHAFHAIIREEMEAAGASPLAVMVTPDLLPPPSPSDGISGGRTSPLPLLPSSALSSLSNLRRSGNVSRLTSVGRRRRVAKKKDTLLEESKRSPHSSSPTTRKKNNKRRVKSAIDSWSHLLEAQPRRHPREVVVVLTDEEEKQECSGWEEEEWGSDSLEEMRRSYKNSGRHHGSSSSSSASSVRFRALCREAVVRFLSTFSSPKEEEEDDKNSRDNKTMKRVREQEEDDGNGEEGSGETKKTREEVSCGQPQVMAACSATSHLAFKHSQYQVHRGLTTSSSSSFISPSHTTSHALAVSLGAALTRKGEKREGGGTVASGPRRTPVLLVGGKMVHQQKKTMTPSSSYGDGVSARQKFRLLLDTVESDPMRSIPVAFQKALSWTPARQQQEEQHRRRRRCYRGSATTSSTSLGTTPLKDEQEEEEEEEDDWAERRSILLNSFLSVVLLFQGGGPCPPSPPTFIQWNKKFVIMIDPHVTTLPAITAPPPHRASSHIISAAAAEEDGESCTGQNSVVWKATSDSGDDDVPPLPPPSLLSPHQRWWLLDPHAIHERIRLEFLLVFAEAFVLHPELESSPPSPHTHTPSHNVPILIDQLHRVQHLLYEMRGAAAARIRKTGTTTTTTPARAVFPVPIPADLVSPVTAMEPLLWGWGWRFDHHPHTGECQYVTHWSSLRIEGFVFRLGTINDLRVVVEDLQHCGAGGRLPLSAGVVDATSSSLTTISVIPSSILSFLVSRSCRGAVMFGDDVTPDMMWEWLTCLQRVRQYYCCAHGRPSAARLVPAS